MQFHLRSRSVQPDISPLRQCYHHSKRQLDPGLLFPMSQQAIQYEVSLLVGAANLNRCLCLMLKMSGLVSAPTKSKSNAGHRSICDRLKSRLQGETISAESTFDAINCDLATSPAAIRLINVLRFNWPCASIGEVRHHLIHRAGTNHHLQFRKRNTR